MKSIKLLKLEQYNDSSKYKLVEDGIYIDLNDSDETKYRIAISYELEEDEDNQYPLEDLLDKFSLYVSKDFPDSKNYGKHIIKVELGGRLEEVQKIKNILGKRAYNYKFIIEGDIVYNNLVIEEEIKNEDEQYIFELISQNIKRGFLSKEELKEIIDDLVLEEELEEQISSDWIYSVIESEFEKLIYESKFWSHPTANEKLERVFDKLRTDYKFIALHDAGYTVEEGEEAVLEEEINLIKNKGYCSEGYCFYQEQDSQRAIESGILPIAFQKLNNEDEEITLQIGCLVYAKLKEEGFKVNWNGNALSRIEIINFNWQKVYEKPRAIEEKPRIIVVPEYKKFKEIKYLLPASSSALGYKGDGGIDDMICLYISGDWEIENLDLDDINDEFGNRVYLILIIGNLTVKNIYCKNSDMGTFLTVLNSLVADNMVVSGQEIYIGGRLTVKDLFWGYYPGNIVVNLFLTANVFIVSNYTYIFLDKDESGQQLSVVNYLFSDQDEEYEFQRSKVSAFFREDCIMGSPNIVDDLNGWNDWLNADQMIENLKKGKPILRENFQLQEPPVVEIPFVFESKAFNNANLLRLRESPLFLDNYTPHATERFQIIEYWKDDDFKRVLVNKEEMFSEIVYFQQDDRALMMQYVKVKQNILEKLRGNTSQYQISISCRTIKDGTDDNWEVYNSLLEQHKKYLSLTQDFWEDLLTEWSEMEYYYLQFQKTVTVEKIEYILSLPVVKAKFSDYYNVRNESIWFKFNWKFRQIDTEQGQCQRITIIRDFSTLYGDKYEFYHFDLKKLENGNVVPVLYTQDENGDEFDNYEVTVSDSGKFKNAAKYFKTLENRMEDINREYLKGLQRRQEYIDQIPKTTPFKTINYNGFDFKLISLHEAHELLKDLKDLEGKEYLYDVFDFYSFPVDVTKGGYFLLAEEDVVLSKLELEGEVFELQETTSEIHDLYILGIIFLKNVMVESHIYTPWDDFSPALIVMGDLKCRNIHLSGNTNYIEGSLYCEFLFAENPGNLYVKDKFKGDCIVADAMQCYFGEIVTIAIVSMYCIYSYNKIMDSEGNIQKQMNFYPDTHFLEDVLKAEIIYNDGTGSRWMINSKVLDDWITKGKSPIDRNKDFQYQILTDTSISPRFNAIFNQELLLSENYRITDDETNHTYAFTSFEWNGKPYREISCSEEDVFGYRARILHSIEENVYTAHLDYLDIVTKEPKLRFSSTLDDTFTSTKAAKHGFCLAEMALKSEIKIAEINSNTEKIADCNKEQDFLMETLILKTLPIEYKNFIDEDDLSDFAPFKFETQDGKIESLVMKFFTLQGDDDVLLLNKIKEFTTSQVLPESLIPIAVDPIKNLILIAVTGNNIGKVYYWAMDEEDHEETFTPKHLHLISETFGDFIGLRKTFEKLDPVQDLNKYSFKPVEGEKIEFTDFNFKLAIIQELMYEKELIFPKFDLCEFVDRYRGREIDLEEEGYDFIPEVTSYFEKLEIDKKFAAEIVEIYQDGSNGVYMNMLWFWDGEDDEFNIKSFKDVEQFPNLRKMTLFYDTPFKERQYLKSRGIEIEDV
ncbi:DUF6892 domain-containing protein [Flavobacterium collinsii]|uniref:Knr4/Smi1-like domain-containing protein n=1 Tax=Flavobacterium collinsii TaxID=1114861 RepID=A0ABN7EJB8_9FLAO|nr:SMI1/KNR4 family protein [Flavobacterium collinsii]CAA9198634.1 hypothetical protein FLACOL7796_02246 [Flavobacterium collinsii]